MKWTAIIIIIIIIWGCELQGRRTFSNNREVSVCFEGRNTKLAAYFTNTLTLTLLRNILWCLMKITASFLSPGFGCLGQRELKVKLKKYKIQFPIFSNGDICLLTVCDPQLPRNEKSQFSFSHFTVCETMRGFGKLWHHKGINTPPTLVTTSTPDFIFPPPNTNQAQLIIFLHCCRRL